MKAPAGQGGRDAGLNNPTVPPTSVSCKRAAAAQRAPDGTLRAGVASAAGDSQAQMPRTTATSANRLSPEARL
jgi:hypothetical protein